MWGMRGAGRGGEGGKTILSITMVKRVTEFPLYSKLKQFRICDRVSGPKSTNSAFKHSDFCSKKLRYNQSRNPILSVVNGRYFERAF